MCIKNIQMQDDFVFQYLTARLCFSASTAARACHSIQDWAAAVATAANANTGSSSSSTATATATTTVASLKKATTNNDDNDVSHRLTIAMDWLCLHLDEQQLEQGFRPNPMFQENKTTTTDSSVATTTTTTISSSTRTVYKP